MGTILKNIVQFTGLVVGVPVSLPHRLNVNGRNVAPKIGGADESGFDVTADETNITVTRQASATTGDVNIYVEYWHTIESVTPLIPLPGKLLGLTPLFFANGGGAAPPTPPSRLLSIYGDGSFGDHVTAGDETWTAIAGAPGAPTIPGGAAFPFAFFNNLTISPGNSVAVGGFNEGENAIVIFVKGTLTIGAGARIHVNGQDGSTGVNINGNPGGAGRKAILGSVDGGAGGTGGFGGLTRANGNGDPGLGGSARPAKATAAMIGGKGGDAGSGPVLVGGAGGTCQPDASWPYSLSQAISLASLLYAIGGGNGGGGGAGAGSSGFGGGGGGGAGTLVIFAKNVVFVDNGCLQAIGGKGGNGHAVENLGSGGGGGATGGSIVVVTENTTLAGIANAGGGAGGAPDGFPADPGASGGPGEVVAFNPMLAAQIPI